MAGTYQWTWVVGEVARGVLANVFGTQCEEDREESAPEQTHFNLNPA
jgi:hypothetical protein